jgi:hypothetical protein
VRERHDYRNYKELNRRANYDRQTNINPNNPFRNEMVEFSAEGLGGSHMKRGNNIINREQYFREKTKEVLNKSMIEDLLEELIL